jgi:hypothetical protein
MKVTCLKDTATTSLLRIRAKQTILKPSKMLFLRRMLKLKRKMRRQLQRRKKQSKRGSKKRDSRRRQVKLLSRLKKSGLKRSNQPSRVTKNQSKRPLTVS